MGDKKYMVAAALLMSGCSHIVPANDEASIIDAREAAALKNLPEYFESQPSAAPSISSPPFDEDLLRAFGDDDRLKETLAAVVENNPNILIAKAAKAQAAADLKGDRAARLPTVQLSGGYGISYRVLDTRNPINQERNTTDWAGIDKVQASWEIDLWGQLRAAVKQGEASLLLAEYNLADLELSLVGQTLTTWLNYVASHKLIEVSEDTLVARQRILNLTERRLLEGTTSALDVRTARTALAGAQADLASRQRTKKDVARALNILMGRYPSDTVSVPLVWPDLGPIHVAGSPLDLLARRPDVRSAEQSLLVSGLAVKRSRTALFPGLALTADIDQTLTSLVENFDLDSVTIGLAKSVAQTLFDGGARRSQIAAAEAQAQQSLGSYVNIALTALNEVEAALTADAFVEQQINAQARALTEAQAAEKIAERSYTNGLISVFQLVNAQTTRLDAERALINLQLARATNRSDFYVALGGGPTDNSYSAIIDIEDN